uniref:Uncharacterized protein n=1 Tax=Arundo donax TaxID=35708 RepID=A0A0A8YZD4_ARUDO
MVFVPTYLYAGNVIASFSLSVDETS